MKVTVFRDKLIAAIEKRIAQETAAFEKAKEDYESKVQKAHTRLIFNLKKEVDRLLRQKVVSMPDRYSYRDTLFDGVDVPTEPKLKLSQHESVLAKLKLSNDEVLTLTEKDDYFDFI